MNRALGLHLTAISRINNPSIAIEDWWYTDFFLGQNISGQRSVKIIALDKNLHPLAEGLASQPNESFDALVEMFKEAEKVARGKSPRHIPVNDQIKIHSSSYDKDPLIDIWKKLNTNTAMTLGSHAIGGPAHGTASPDGWYANIDFDVSLDGCKYHVNLVAPTRITDNVRIRIKPSVDAQYIASMPWIGEELSIPRSDDVLKIFNSCLFRRTGVNIPGLSNNPTQSTTNLSAATKRVLHKS